MNACCILHDAEQTMLLLICAKVKIFLAANISQFTTATNKPLLFKNYLNYIKKSNKITYYEWFELNFLIGLN